MITFVIILIAFCLIAAVIRLKVNVSQEIYGIELKVEITILKYSHKDYWQKWLTKWLTKKTTTKTPKTYKDER